MKKTDLDKKTQALLAKQHFESFAGEKNRARSISVGNASGGVTEITLRKINGETTWYLMQPVEVVELIHQLAANVGCHINLKPREDFASWRGWNPVHNEQPRIERSEHPPHPEGLDERQEIGAKLPRPEEQPGMKLTRSKQNVVATKKTVNGRNTKRAARAP